MKHEQVVVDYWTMIKTSGLCLLLAFSGYILLKMVQTIFWLPGHLRNNQQRLEELAAQYAQEIEEEERIRLGRMIKGEEGPNDNQKIENTTTTTAAEAEISAISTEEKKLK